MMILPDRDTILHILSSNCDMARFYFNLLQKDREVPFPIPFIKNNEDQSPLHKFFQESNLSECDENVMKDGRIVEFYLQEVLP